MTGAVRLAEVADLSKVVQPFGLDLRAPSLNNGSNITQHMSWDLRVVVTEKTFPGLGDPQFRGVSTGRALADMDMDRLDRSSLGHLEKYPV